MELSRFKNLWTFKNLFTFSVIFAKISHNFANIIYHKNFEKMSVIGAIRIGGTCETVWLESLWLKYLIKIFKNSDFVSSKIAQNMFLWSALIKFANSGDPETADTIFLNSKLFIKTASWDSTPHKSLLELKFQLVYFTKVRKTWLVCSKRGNNRDRFDNIMDSHNQNFFFGAARFLKYFAFF